MAGPDRQRPNPNHRLALREALTLVADLLWVVLLGAFVICAIALMIRGRIPEAVGVAFCARCCGVRSRHR